MFVLRAWYEVCTVGCCRVSSNALRELERLYMVGGARAQVKF